MPNLPTAKGASSPSRILVCDYDDVGTRTLIGVLESAGYVCVVAETHSIAWARLSAERFELVIADMVTPPAFEFVRALAEAPDAPPVLVVTAAPSLAAVQRALRMRVVDYLVQPVDDAALLAAVRNGVAAHCAFRTLRVHRGRLEHSLQEMTHCEDLVRHSEGGSKLGPLDTYLTLATRHAIETINELGDVARIILMNRDSGGAADRLQNARPLQLIDAIRETILVLEHTKSSFRSRELADLRKKLEGLLRGVGTTDSAA